MRIYVAGPYTAPTPTEMFDNMRRGMRLATKLLLKGHSPFCPFLDYHFQLQLREPKEVLTVEDYYRYSLDWLEVSDAVILLPGYERSVGTVKEIERANKLQIPVYSCYKNFVRG